MSQYKEARERTKAKIEDAYWDLMIKNERITVKKIIEKAGIHKSTFYFYYEWVDDVLTEIKTRMMKRKNLKNLKSLFLHQEIWQ